MFSKKEKKITKEWVNQKIGYLYLFLKDEMDKTRIPFFPSKDFYSEWNKNDSSLMIMAQKILSYLGESIDDITVCFHGNLGDTPGMFTNQYERNFIFVNSKYVNNPYAIGAILSHELMHFYLISKKHIVLEDKEENELLTDLGTIYLGLGILIVNGFSYESNWFLTFFRVTWWLSLY